MDETTLVDTQHGEVSTAAAASVAQTDVMVVEELLVEEISIDGMCGVY